MKTPLFEPGPSGRVPGRAAARNLAAELNGTPGIVVQRGAATTFEALHVAGPAGELFVSVHEPDEATALYLAPEYPHAERCAVLGTVDQLTTVARIIRRSVGAAS